MSKYTIIHTDHIKNVYEETDVPGEFKPFKNDMGGEQLAVTLLIIPPHSDFEQGAGHYHSDLEEVYIITKGTLTMRFDEDIVKVEAGSVARVDPEVVRSHRNEGDEEVQMWAISRKITEDDSHIVRNFWQASGDAKQSRKPK